MRSPFRNVYIPESAKIGEQIRIKSAHDIDSTHNGFIRNVSLEYSEDAIPFRLKYFSHQNFLFLVVVSLLDREKKSNYILTISAVDDGRPEKTGYGQINITVVDENDNPPVFESENMELFVSEKYSTSRYNRVFKYFGSRFVPVMRKYHLIFRAMVQNTLELQTTDT